MDNARQRRTVDLTFRVALEAVTEQQTLRQRASAYAVHPGHITPWNTQLLDGGSGIVGQHHVRALLEQTARKDERFAQIGRLPMELAEQTVPCSPDAKRALRKTTLPRTPSACRQRKPIALHAPHPSTFPEAACYNGANQSA